MPYAAIGMIVCFAAQAIIAATEYRKSMRDEARALTAARGPLGLRMVRRSYITMMIVGPLGALLGVVELVLALH